MEFLKKYVIHDIYYFSQSMTIYHAVSYFISIAKELNLMNPLNKLLIYRKHLIAHLTVSNSRILPNITCIIYNFHGILGFFIQKTHKIINLYFEVVILKSITLKRLMNGLRVTKNVVSSSRNIEPMKTLNLNNKLPILL